MKAIITIELKGVPSETTQVLSVEAPTLNMLKTNLTRTCLLQIPDLITMAFEEAAKAPLPTAPANPNTAPKQKTANKKSKAQPQPENIAGSAEQIE